MLCLERILAKYGLNDHSNLGITLNAMNPVIAAVIQKYNGFIFFKTNKVSIVIRKITRNIEIICFSFIID